LLKCILCFTYKT